MSADNTTNIPGPEDWRDLLANPYLAGPIKFVLPFVIALGIFAGLYLIESYHQFLVISGLLAAYFFPPAGKESIIPIAIMMGYPWWLVTLAIFLLDVAVSLFVVWNFDLALKIPLIGRLLESGMTAGRTYTDARPWLRRFSTIGLIFLVFFPFQGTGAMNGAILGRLLGLDMYRVFSCVCIGSLASSLALALGSDALLDVYHQNPMFGIGILAAIVVAVLAAVMGWRIHKGRLRERIPR